MLMVLYERVLSLVWAAMERLRGEKGQTMTEYAIILAAIAVLAATIWLTPLKDAISDAFSDAASAISGVGGS